MKRRHALKAAAASAIALLTLSACGANPGSTDAADQTPLDPANPVTITVGASPRPHTQILEFINQNLAQDAGIQIDITEFDDYNLPNIALQDGSLDANFYQHLPYLQSQSADRGYDFEYGAGVHVEPYAAFSEKFENIDEVPDDGKIAITNDPANQTRALKLLEVNGLLENVPDDASVLTLTDDQNPKSLQFSENQPELLVNDLNDPTVDLAIINGNYILDAGLSTQDAVAVESLTDNQYANFLVWRAGESTPAIEKLEELLHTPEVKEFIETTWPAGDVSPAF